MKRNSQAHAPERAKTFGQISSIALATVSTLALSSMPGFSQSTVPTIEEIQTFDDLDPMARSEAIAISGDGTVAVGEALITGGWPRPFMFSGGTLTNLDPSAPDPSISRATGVNQDGTVVSGTRQTPSDSAAFYWTQATGLVTFANPPGTDSIGNAISGDGTKILGTQFAGNPVAFVWTHATNAVDYLSPITPGGYIIGNDISDDGSIVVGFASRLAGPDHAFRTVVGGATTDLGSLVGATGSSRANGVSGDGLVVVGQSSTLSSGTRAFRWTQGTGMVQLNSPDEPSTTFSTANAASSDGSFVAGTYTGAAGSRALLWDAAGVATDLGDLTSDNSGTSVANGISDDGSVVVGYSTNDAGDTRGFIWRDAVAPTGPGPGPGPGTMLDHVNTLTQIANSAASQAAGAAYLDKITLFALGQSVEVQNKGTEETLSSRGVASSSLPVAMRVAAGGANNPDGNNTALLGLTAAVAIQPGLSLGGYFGLGTDEDNLGDFGIDGNFASYGLYLQGGHTGSEGLSWKVAAAHTGANVDITRSTALAGTERGTGNTDMSARASSVQLGYGMRKGSALIMPFMRLARSVVQRDGYSETSSVAFPVTYDDYETSATIATLGADYRMPITQSGVLKLTAGIEWDLSRSTDAVTGTSAIPGMASFAIASPMLEHDQRLFAEARYTHDLNNGRAYDVGLGVHQTPYADKPSLMATVGYQMNF